MSRTIGTPQGQMANGLFSRNFGRPISHYRIILLAGLLLPLWGSFTGR
ncbi:MAG: hypothetical protein M1299_13020 [Firmicutes bacterium]|nr:hypothetical protein [Bacillota bacterium]